MTQLNRKRALEFQKLLASEDVKVEDSKFLEWLEDEFNSVHDEGVEAANELANSFAEDLMELHNKTITLLKEWVGK